MKENLPGFRGEMLKYKIICNAAIYFKMVQQEKYVYLHPFVYIYTCASAEGLKKKEACHVYKCKESQWKRVVRETGMHAQTGAKSWRVLLWMRKIFHFVLRVMRILWSKVLTWSYFSFKIPLCISFLPIYSENVPRSLDLPPHGKGFCSLQTHSCFPSPPLWWPNMGPLWAWWFSLQGKYPGTGGFPCQVTHFREGDHRPLRKGVMLTSERCGCGGQPDVSWPGKRNGSFWNLPRELKASNSTTWVQTRGEGQMSSQNGDHQEGWERIPSILYWSSPTPSLPGQCPCPSHSKPAASSLSWSTKLETTHTTG